MFKNTCVHRKALTHRSGTYKLFDKATEFASHIVQIKSNQINFIDPSWEIHLRLPAISNKRGEKEDKKKQKTTLILCSIREYSVGPKKKKRNLGNICTDNNIT